VCPAGDGGWTAEKAYVQSAKAIAVVTIVARNYVAYARTLMQSMAVHAPDLERFVFIVDDLNGDERIPEATILPPLDVFDSATYLGLAYSYDVTEMSTATKPFILRHLLHRGFSRAYYFDPDIQVFSALDPMLRSLDASDVVLTPHATEPIPLDGKKPDEPVLLRAGAYNLGFIGVANRPPAIAMLDWWAQRLEFHCVNDVANGFFVDQKWMDLVPGMLENVAILRHRGCNVAYWNLHYRRISETNHHILEDGTPLIFFHYSGFDVRKTDQLSRHQTRVDLKVEPGLRSLLADYSRRIIANGHLERMHVPYGFNLFSNGVALDRASRTVLREAQAAGIRFADPHDVSASPSAWEYLNESVDTASASGPKITRYLAAMAEVRPDLRPAFPDIFGASRAAYFHWLRTDATSGIDPAYLSDTVQILSDFGVNVAGYFRTESGVGEAGRAHVAALRAGGIPTTLVDYSRYAPSRADDHTLTPHASNALNRINLVCVNADQALHFKAEVGETFFRGRYNIASWWWELPEFPDRWSDSFAPFDEIWAGSHFVASAIEAKSPIPVLLVPPVVDVGSPGVLPKAHFGFAPNETMFLFVFDFLSVFERKNPLAVIDAFQRAFRSGESAGLIVKCINGERDPAGMRKLSDAIGDDRRIRVIDRYLSRAEKNDLLASCDAYVSLHRSEGFGYTPAEAMALGRTVIATGWSGNMDYMNHGNSIPVDYRLVALESGAGPYDAGQYWADPDLDDAARAMRRVHTDPAGVRRLGINGRVEIATKFSAAAVGRIAGNRIDFIESRMLRGKAS
jgi:glycosyltransferase involved in cell wall biosynthesis